MGGRMDREGALAAGAEAWASCAGTLRHGLYPNPEIQLPLHQQPLLTPSIRYFFRRDPQRLSDT
jgi:hypothetical protein